MKNTLLARLLWLSFIAPFAAFGAPEQPAPPKVGDQAPDFSLNTLDGRTVQLKELTDKGKVVMLFLRGWPGYQCPICTAQVHDFVGASEGFASAKARVIMIYPGPAQDLKAHAAEFLQDKTWPKSNFLFVLDPDFTAVKRYGLRWEAPKETAYPSTFVLDSKGIVRFAQISHSHGNRTKAAQILKFVEGMAE